MHKQVSHAHVHIRKLKCKVNKIIMVCFFSKTYYKSLSLPLMTEILCAKPSNFIYISRMHAILSLLHSLYLMPCELNHFIVRVGAAVGRKLFSPHCVREQMHQKVLLLLPLRGTPGEFELATVQLSISSKRKSHSTLGSLTDLILFPVKFFCFWWW